MKLSQEEFNKRCYEVFDAQEGDEYYGIEVEDDGTVVINMSEITIDGQTVIFDFEPNMEERPTALQYLLGNRDDFND